MMKKILKWLMYDVDENKRKNRARNNADLVLVFLYMTISLYNAFFESYNIQIFDSEGRFIQDSITTLLIVSINFIILIRMYIKIKNQKAEYIEEVKGKLLKNERYDKIVIEALVKRLNIIKNVWLISAVILIFVGFFGKPVVQSVAVIAAIIAGLTFVNDVLDIAVNKYSAVPIPGLVTYRKEIV